MDWIRLLKEVVTDPKVAPRLFIFYLVFMLFWISLMQGINANLWSNDLQLENLPTTYQESK